VRVTIKSGSGSYGNTCSYGRYSYTLSNRMTFDNVEVKWNGTIPKGDGKLDATGLPHPHERGATYLPRNWSSMTRTTARILMRTLIHRAYQAWRPILIASLCRSKIPAPAI